MGWDGLWCAKNLRVMPAARKGFLHTNIQRYKMSPVHVAAQINRFADSFLGPERIMGMLRIIRAAGDPGFPVPQEWNVVCAGHPEIPLNSQHSGTKKWTPSLQLRHWHSPGAEGGTQGSTIPAG